MDQDEEIEFREWVKGIDSRDMTARNAWAARALMTSHLQTAAYAEGRTDQYAESVEVLTRLRRDNAALLAALSKIAGLAPGEGDVCELIARIARAAIAQAQEPQP